VGLTLALLAARTLAHAQVTLFDARPAERDVGDDPRTLALSLGSVQLLERLGAWRAERAQAIHEVHVSQQPPSMPAPLSRWLGESGLRIRAADEGVPMLGAVLSYGAIVAPLQQVWEREQRADPTRLHSRFGHPVAALKNLTGGVEVDAQIAERYDLAVVAEGGVFADQVRKSLRHDYQQTAWVGTASFAAGRAPGGVAYERFTRHGPAALLPLRSGAAGLVWCVPRDDDPVRGLSDAQRVTVLNSVFAPDGPRLASVSALKSFALGLNAERTLSQGRTVRIGNAAQTLHPVAGQGLNLGLRDAFELVRALARRADVDAVLRELEWQRGPDRWAMIAATDFLARSFTWTLPGAGAARALGIAALQRLAPVKSALARQMMFGSR
jgi:2-octaprenyl-6-methoxyphenol hydroxylase